ncbi:right-handed parallel beta-helix repeat-containing protein [Haloarchaeobius sp. HME9146]|uniref:right-handed parallel beta-helix repeat-containing protein n=1 Tax=Haloarchaeobius sp. HME9146 TaxID=2978732 RepID=UPI0021BE5AB5|nr:right-handed parallel beta-helix repeat-containing protein [Haloarchaeobius sp. HME9146]MCT9096065.1 right-handed parallel beta-helix repeat-containing protein [Haloarchaeobius sp. HME9146]
MVSTPPLPEQSTDRTVRTVSRRRLLALAGAGASFGAWARPVAAGHPTVVPAGAGRIRLFGTGQRYVLEGDIEGPIEVAGRGVSLDGNGYTITPRENRVGIDVDRSRGVRLENLRIVGGGTAIRLRDSRGVRVRDAWIRRSGVGVDMEDAAGRLDNLTIVGTRNSGIRLKDTRAVVTATTVQECGRRGRSSGIVADTERDIQFRRCLSRGSGRHGFVLDGDDEATLTVVRCGAMENRGDGFDVEDFTETQLRCSVALSNGGSGFDIDGIGALAVVRTSAVRNDDHGFDIYTRNPAQLVRTTAFRNRDDDYRLTGPVFQTAAGGPIRGRCSPAATVRLLRRQAVDAETAGVLGSQPGTGWLDEFETGPGDQDGRGRGRAGGQGRRRAGGRGRGRGRDRGRHNWG